MSELQAGWYPNPDGSGNERRWDGNSWTAETRDYPPPAAKTNPSTDTSGENVPPRRSPTSGVADRLKRAPLWLKVSAIAAMALIVALIASIAFALSTADHEADDSTPTRSAPPVTAPRPTPAAPLAPVEAPEPQPTIVPMGEPIVSPNYSLIIDSVEILDRIETTHGGPILADPGTDLVMMRSTITITGNAQDLSCGSDLFMQAYDSNGSQMADVFEGPRIPGNPECNLKTSAGQTVAWNIIFKIASGRTPTVVAIIDTNVDGNYTWGEEIIASLQ